MSCGLWFLRFESRLQRYGFYFIKTLFKMTKLEAVEKKTIFVNLYFHQIINQRNVRIPSFIKQYY